MIIEDCFSDQSIVYRWVCHFLKNLISFFSKALNHTIISLTLCKDKVTCEPITYPFLVIKIILHLFFLCIGELKISLYIYEGERKKSSELNQCYNKNTLKSHRFWNALFHVQAHFTNIELADAVELSPSHFRIYVTWGCWSLKSSQLTYVIEPCNSHSPHRNLVASSDQHSPR